MRAVGRLDHQELWLRLALSGLVELHLVRGAFRDNDVVLGEKVQRAERAVHRARAVMDEDALVAHTVLVVVVHRLGGCTEAHLAIGVAEQHHSPSDRITFRLHRHRLEMPHPHRVGLDIFGLRRIEHLPAGDLRRRMDVVQRGGRADESLRAKDLLGIQRPVGATKLDVPLGRQLTELEVVGHGACSSANSSYSTLIVAGSSAEDGVVLSKPRRVAGEARRPRPRPAYEARRRGRKRPVRLMYARYSSPNFLIRFSSSLEVRAHNTAKASPHMSNMNQLAVSRT